MNSNFLPDMDPVTIKTASVFKALGHPLRLLILSLLKEGPLNAGEIEKLSGASQSNTSQHLSLLHRAGLVHRKRQGNSIYYRVENWRIFKLISQAENISA